MLEYSCNKLNVTRPKGLKTLEAFWLNIHHSGKLKIKAFYHHKSIGFIFLPISIIPENLTSIGQSVLELLSKIAKFVL